MGAWFAGWAAERDDSDLRTERTGIGHPQRHASDLAARGRSRLARSRCRRSVGTLAAVRERADARLRGRAAGQQREQRRPATTRTGVGRTTELLKSSRRLLEELRPASLKSSGGAL